VLSGIQGAGFIPVASSSALPVRRGIPVRWSAIIVTIILWNALFMLPFAGRSRAASVPNWLVLAPLVAVFGLSIGILVSQKLQHLILKPGRSVGEIRPFLLLLACIAGMLIIVFTFLLAIGAFNHVPNEPGRVNRRQPLGFCEYVGEARVNSWGPVALANRRPAGQADGRGTPLGPSE
jgi:hypothetical protein